MSSHLDRTGRSVPRTSRTPPGSVVECAPLRFDEPRCRGMTEQALQLDPTERVSTDCAAAPVPPKRPNQVACRGHRRGRPSTYAAADSLFSSLAFLVFGGLAVIASALVFLLAVFTRGAKLLSLVSRLRRSLALDVCSRHRSPSDYVGSQSRRLLPPATCKSRSLSLTARSTMDAHV